jgi:hypothetical protein
MLDKKVTWRLHIEMIEAKGFRTFIRIYSLFKSERLSTNFKLTLHKALMRSKMTYTCPAWEFAADNYLLKLQRLQNKVLRTIGNFPRRKGRVECGCYCELISILPALSNMFFVRIDRG